jgi:hypothetical protein
MGCVQSDERHVESVYEFPIPRKDPNDFFDIKKKDPNDFFESKNNNISENETNNNPC